MRLEEKELKVPEDALFTGVVGAAVHAGGRLEADGKCNLERAEKDQEYCERMLFCYRELAEKLEHAEARKQMQKSLLPKLVLSEGTCLDEPEVTGVIPEDGCALGIDIGSTSTDLVLTDKQGNIIDFQYLRTAGNPEGVVRKGLASIWERFGEVADFQMNKICAAGTGSFVEEQAARMGIPISEFGPLALTSENPSELGERCTVFIETAIASAESAGAS